MTKEKEKNNIFEVFDEIADVWGEWLTIDSFSKIITKFCFIYVILGATTWAGFLNFDYLGMLGTFAFGYIILIDIFTLYCELFRGYIIF